MAKKGGRAIDQGSKPSGSHAKAVSSNKHSITKAIPPGADHQRDGLNGIPASKSKKQS